MSITVMKQALEALEMLARYENPQTAIQVRKPKDGGPIVTMYPHKVATDAANALRTAIAEAEKQEPVAWMVKAHGLLQRLSRRADVADEIACQYRKDDPKADMFPLYTAPPQRKPLTDEEIVKITSDPCLYIRGGDYRIDIARAIEAAHGIREKNT